jgi:hypothetical protein
LSIYAEQLRRWQNLAPSAAQRRELNRLDEQKRRLRQATSEVLTLGAELRKGTVNRIMAMSDLELGLQAMLGTLPPLTSPSTLRAIRYRALLRALDRPRPPVNKAHQEVDGLSLPRRGEERPRPRNDPACLQAKGLDNSRLI